MRAFFARLLSRDKTEEKNPMKKLLIVGLGNPGPKYENTRHNIGFKILDELAEQRELTFTAERYADKADFNFKGRKFILIKPTTFMNLSGKAVRYWMDKENIAVQNLLVITDDLNLTFGTLRLKAKGSDGGHNGLKNIQELLQTTTYPRFRFGISDAFSKGSQIDYVLSEWSQEEQKILKERLETSAELILSFGTAGIQNTMNNFNGK
ncbi:aminoacyl-tRNA hydrolase [Psychroflexus sp. YR1-1]|uniref:Peptidyl-tRNA hydrolase n=1 Tax=Psychroflexus aurantiacus TaxID=2709310 RepID=A0A6B3QYB7_9FLAO|nr:aminoacyl-tRNA hydrolase [Psychroflexus aurantiacus]NEV92658.1 aminoacyl-tRNA hydrolase [Psychroflexus aurantiacus]